MGAAGKEGRQGEKGAKVSYTEQYAHSVPKPRKILINICNVSCVIGRAWN